MKHCPPEATNFALALAGFSATLPLHYPPSSLPLPFVDFQSPCADLKTRFQSQLNRPYRKGKSWGTAAFSFSWPPLLLFSFFPPLLRRKISYRLLSTSSSPLIDVTMRSLSMAGCSRIWLQMNSSILSFNHPFAHAFC